MTEKPNCPFSVNVPKLYEFYGSSTSDEELSEIKEVLGDTVNIDIVETEEKKSVHLKITCKLLENGLCARSILHKHGLDKSPHSEFCKLDSLRP